MASHEIATLRRDGTDGTYVEILKGKWCQKIFGKAICTPWVKQQAHVHLGAEPAKRVSHGAGEAAAAISGTLVATGVGVVAAPWVALAGGLAVIGYEGLKNDDGSIDLFINNIAVRAGSARIPVSIDPASSSIILQSL